MPKKRKPKAKLKGKHSPAEKPISLAPRSMEDAIRDLAPKSKRPDRA
jgi:hypothetical protein